MDESSIPLNKPAGTATSDEDVLREGRHRFRLVADAESRMRADMLADLKFRKGEQWDPQVAADRKADKRPMLTIDKLRQPLRQIVNQQRQSKLAIDVHPKGGAATDEIADVFQGLIRHIEVQSNADVAYSWAFEYAASIGRGFFRILTEYSNDGDEDQDIRIMRILNPFTVYVDPTCIEPDYSDMGYCLHVEDFAPDEFKTKYGDKRLSSAEEFQSIGDQAPFWLVGGKVRVAQYWRVVLEGQTRGENGAERPAKRRVEWFEMSGVEVLDRGQWAGRYIPFVPVIGEELDVDGERILQGIIRSAMDPARMYNYWVTAQTEMIALAPRAPWVAAEGQLEGHPEWFTANTRNHAVLQYKLTALNGQLAPAPTRMFAEPPIQAITVAVGQANEDIKGVTGVYDPSLGRLSPSERSGKAIQALQQQGNTANANYLDNLARSISYAGKILVDLIPHIYNRPGRVARLLGEDDQASTVILNQSFMPGKVPQPIGKLPPGMPMPEGAQTIDLAAGQYAVAVSVGVGFQTRRQEGQAALEAIMQAAPHLAMIVADKWVGNMEFPGHRAIEKRLKKALPPQFQDEEEGEQPIPQKAQAYIAQLEQQHEQLIAVCNEQKDKLDTDEAKAQATLQIKTIEVASRERIAAYQAQVDLLKVQATIDAKRTELEIKAYLEQMQQVVAQSHERVMGESAQQHEVGMSQLEADQARELAQQQQAADAAQQGAGAAHEAGMQGAAQAHEVGMQGADQAHETGMQGAQQGHEAKLATAAAKLKAAPAK